METTLVLSTLSQIRLVREYNKIVQKDYKVSCKSNQVYDFFAEEINRLEEEAVNTYPIELEISEQDTRSGNPEFIQFSAKDFWVMNVNTGQEIEV